MVLQAYAPVIGGAQRQVQRLAPLLAEREIDVLVVTRRPPGAPRREHTGAARIERVSSGWGGARAAAEFVVAATRTVIDERPAIVHVHDLLSPASVGVAVKALRHVPLVTKVASSGPGGDLALLRGRRAGHARLRAVIAATDRFACLTADVQDELGSAGARASQLQLLPNGVDTRRFRPATSADERRAARARFGLPDGPIALYAGRLTAVKHLDVAAEACRRAGVPLVVAGDGPFSAPLARHPSVRLLGRVDDLPALHRCADVYVSASRTEGMSGAMLEAMATGVPVAAVMAGGVRELLGSGAGCIAAGQGPVELEEAVRSALTGVAQGAVGRTKAQAELSLSAAADRLALLYCELVAQRRAKTAGRSIRARATRTSAGTQMRRMS